MGVGPDGTNTVWTMLLVWDIMLGWYIYGKITVCGMVCDDGMVRGKHSIWYGTFAVWYHGTVLLWVYFIWLNFPGGMVCFIR